MASTVDPRAQRLLLAEPTRPSAPRAIVRVAPIALALRLSRALLVVSGIAGLVSVAAPSIFRDAPAYAGNALGTYVVILVVALPTMALAMYYAARGSLRAHFVWLGTVVLPALRRRARQLLGPIQRALPRSTSRRSRSPSRRSSRCCAASPPTSSPRASRLDCRRARSAAISSRSASPSPLLWLADVLPALTSGDVPRSLRGTSLPTNVVQVLDFGFTLPLCIAAGVWLMRRRPWGILLSGMLLVFFTLESVSVAVDQWFGHHADSLAARVGRRDRSSCSPSSARCRCSSSSAPSTHRTCARRAAARVAERSSAAR